MTHQWHSSNVIFDSINFLKKNWKLFKGRLGIRYDWTGSASIFCSAESCAIAFLLSQKLINILWWIFYSSVPKGWIYWKSIFHVSNVRWCVSARKVYCRCWPEWAAIWDSDLDCPLLTIDARVKKPNYMRYFVGLGLTHNNWLHFHFTLYSDLTYDWCNKSFETLERFGSFALRFPTYFSQCDGRGCY